MSLVVIDRFNLIHYDVWGPAPQFDNHDFSYYVLFVDNWTRMSWVYFLKNKSEVFDVFVTFYKMLLTQFKAQIHILKSDNGSEHINIDMKQFITNNGLIHQTSYNDTSQ